MRNVRCHDCGKRYNFDKDDFCPRCGAQITGLAVFCHNCGVRLMYGGDDDEKDG